MIKEQIKHTKYKKITNTKIKEVIEILDNYYPDAKCSLDFKQPIELVVALILAAQCTDERVNRIVPVLFERFPTVYDLSLADVNEIETIIRSCGFYRNKAKSIYETANIVVENFNGNIPDNMNDLCTLRGIGRKSSNIILQECFNQVEGIAVDTHVKRLTRKIGISNENTPEKIEIDMKKKINKIYWDKVNHIFVYHGRAICIARRPNCIECPINHICAMNP